MRRDILAARTDPNLSVGDRLALSSAALTIMEFGAVYGLVPPNLDVDSGVMAMALSGGSGGRISSGGETGPVLPGTTTTFVAAKGLPDGAKWAQKTFGPNFDPRGTLAGKSFDDVVGGLRSGAIKPSSIQVDYVVRDGQVIIHNTRSASALDAAGIPRSQWNAVNQTGSAAVEARVSGQLARNPGGPFETVKPSW